jgi:hypothetical protein
MSQQNAPAIRDITRPVPDTGKKSHDRGFDGILQQDGAIKFPLPQHADKAQETQPSGMFDFFIEHHDIIAIGMALE